jgi:leader peptidase (prepilin peptidase) / N-methyltransferase
MARIFDPDVWAAVPPEFWALVFFGFGCMVGSFLNVCIHRMPRGMSVVSPPSHCPHCAYAIPWYLNVPLITWLVLRGRCAHCRAAISARYFVVELLTGLAFLGSWAAFRPSAGLALVYCLLLAGFIGGMVAGALCSLLVPALHRSFGDAADPAAALALIRSFVGMAVGAGLVYGVVRIGKMLFGREHIELPPDTRIVFTDTGIVLPGEVRPYEDIFYRKSDVIVMEARTVELIDRCYRGVVVRLRADELRIGDEAIDPAAVQQMEVVADKITLPREAMGFGDVKFMGAIGAFLGWQATVFSLLFSSVIGAAVGVTLIALRKQEWSSRLPYGPYIALAATVWIFCGQRVLNWWLGP